MVLTRFYVCFIFIIQVNIGCTIRECFPFFYVAILSSFLIVVHVVGPFFKFSLTIFADGCVFLNVVNRAVAVVQTFERV